MKKLLTQGAALCSYRLCSSDYRPDNKDIGKDQYVLA